MSYVAGVAVPIGSTLSAGGKLRVDFKNPRGKMTFAREVNITNTGANAMEVIVPQDPPFGTGGTPVDETAITIPAGANRIITGNMAFIYVRSTSGTTWSGFANVAG
jgi:hypothetical protein